MPFVEANGERYHYQRYGKGEPLLLLHGFTGRVENWAQLIPKLSLAYHTIAIDLLGHGQTDAPAAPHRYAMPAAAKDLITIIDALDLSPLHLYGYSMGGRLSLYLALHYPERIRSLTLESSSPGLKTAAERTARKEMDESLATQIETEGVTAFVDYWEQLPLFASQHKLPVDVRTNHRQWRLQNRPEGLANSLRGMGTGVQPSLWSHLSQIQPPVQLIVGELDQKFVQIGQEMTGLLPRVNLNIVPAAGHAVHLEHPEVVVQILLFSRQ